jgi:hypothetical protein
LSLQFGSVENQSEAVDLLGAFTVDLLKSFHDHRCKIAASQQGSDQGADCGERCSDFMGDRFQQGEFRFGSALVLIALDRLVAVPSPRLVPQGLKGQTGGHARQALRHHWPELLAVGATALQRAQGSDCVMERIGLIWGIRA